jgi:hypothetical protein
MLTIWAGNPLGGAITHPRLLAGFVLLIAAVLTWFQIPVASSQGLTLVAARVEGDLPVANPDDALWQQATAIAVPLSAQNVTRPILPATRVKAVTARALHNDKQLALLVEWSDDTQNDQSIRIQDFRDAVAVQFPLAEGQPYFCMGQQGGNVNIWHWKADWQAAIAARQALTATYPNLYVDQYPFTEPTDNVLLAEYTDPHYLPAQAVGNLFASGLRVSPVEDLLAGGFGSLTAQSLADQNVQGYGVWANGRWRVTFSRDLASPEVDDISFAAGKVYSVAFAAWDGANGERNGQKSTSQWVTLQLAGAAAAPAAAQPATAPATAAGMRISVFVIIAILVLALFAVAFFAVYFSLPQ